MALFFTRTFRLTKNQILVSTVLPSVLAILGVSSTAAQQQPTPVPPQSTSSFQGSLSTPHGKTVELQTPEPSSQSSTLDVDPEVSAVLRTDVPVSRIIISDPNVVHVVPKTTTEITLIGNQPGETDVTLWLNGPEEKQDFISYRVRITPESVATSSIKRITLLEAVRAKYPESEIEIKSIHDKYLVRGTAKNEAEANQILSDIRTDVLQRTDNNSTKGFGLAGDITVDKSADPVAKQVISLLDVVPRPQTLLKVRAIEFDRTVIEKLLANSTGEFSKLFSPGQVNWRAARGVLFDTEGMTQTLTKLLSSDSTKVLMESDLVVPDGRNVRFLPSGSYRVNQAAATSQNRMSLRQASHPPKHLLLTPRLTDEQQIGLSCSPPFNPIGDFPVPPRFKLNGSRATGITVEFESGQWLVISHLIQPEIGLTRDAQKGKSKSATPKNSVLVFVGAEIIKSRESDDVVLYIPAANDQVNSASENLRRLASMQYYLSGDFGFSRKSTPDIPQYADLSMAHELGIAAAEEGDFVGAESDLLAAIEWDPSDANLLNDVGYCCYLQNRLEHAEKYLNRAISLSPQNRKTFNNLGLVLAARQKYSKSLTMLRSAASSEADGYANFAYALVQQNKLHNAQLYFSRALRLNGRLRKVGQAMIQLNDFISTAPALAISDDISKELINPTQGVSFPATLTKPNRTTVGPLLPSQRPSHTTNEITLMPNLPVSPKTVVDPRVAFHALSHNVSTVDPSVVRLLPVVPARHSTVERSSTAPYQGKDSFHLMAPAPRQPDGQPLPRLLPMEKKQVSLAAKQQPLFPKQNTTQTETPREKRIELSLNWNRANRVSFVQALKSSIKPVVHGDFMIAPVPWRKANVVPIQAPPQIPTFRNQSRPNAKFAPPVIPVPMQNRTSNTPSRSEFNLSD